MNKSFKYRIYPSNQQKEMFAKTFGCCRFVYNSLLNWRNTEYTTKGIKINYNHTSSKLTEIKKNPEYAWLNEVSSVALQQVLRNQDKAYMNFFKKNAKYPKFKRKNNNQSFQLMTNAFKFKDGNLYVAKSEEPLTIKWHRPMEGKVTSLTISKDCANRYFISFCCEEIDSKPLSKPLPIVEKTVGIDVGLTTFVVTSDGEKIKPLKALLKYQDKLAKLQRKKSKMQLLNKANGIKDSNRCAKARLRIAKVHNKITDSRKDFLHKLSTKLINENQVICLEDLNIAGMIKNPKLAKHIADASWSEFNRQLEYKAQWYGRTISKVNTWYPSSQLCSNCGFDSGKKPLNIRSWTCTNCETFHDRDINASKNIHTAGLAEI